MFTGLSDENIKSDLIWEINRSYYQNKYEAYIQVHQYLDHETFFWPHSGFQIKWLKSLALSFLLADVQ